MIPSHTTTGQTQARFLVGIPDDGLTDGVVIARLRTSGTVARWDVVYTTALSGSLEVRVYDRDGTRLNGTSTAGGVDGAQWRLSIELTQDGSDVDWQLWVARVDGPFGITGPFGTLPGRTVGRATSFQVGPDGNAGDVAVGHITVHTKISSILDIRQEIVAFRGETAVERIQRLCFENGVPVRIVGEYFGVARMGPQRAATLLELLEEAAAADGGLLVEARGEVGLEYRTRASLYNQAPALELTYGQPGLAAPWEPVDDDQHIRNRVTAARDGGSSALVELTSGPLSTQPPPAGVGLYDESVTLAVAADADLPDQAAWRVHLGTVDKARYPALGVKLHKAPAKIAAAARMDLGDLATVVELPAWLPPEPVAGIVQGVFETIELLRWRIDCVTTPAAPWRVTTIEEDRYADDGGSVLADGVGEADTALSVATTSGPLWTTAAADLPLDVMVGGERLTVTAISGESSPQTFTAVRSVNGITKSHSAGAGVALADPTVYAL